MNKSKLLTVIIFSLIFINTSAPFCLADNTNLKDKGKKRDPFVALVHSDGKIKSWEELFPQTKVTLVSANVHLKAIIWDDDRPLALIDKKIYAEGQEIKDGLKVEKIHPNSVDLNNRGSIMTIQLRTLKEGLLK